ncbi:transcriptional regulator BetI [compost metagenome]
MPIIVNREEVKQHIISAFQECIKEQPLASISMRDVAKKANMSHQKLLYYFKDKNDLLYSYVMYAKDFFSSKCMQWFDENDRSNFNSNSEYINRFLEYVANGREDEQRPNATIQIYVLAQYDKEIAVMVQDMFASWKVTMYECLKNIYGDVVAEKEAEAMMILISGTFLCHYNHVLTGSINSEILDRITKLSINN